MMGQTIHLFEVVEVQDVKIYFVELEPENVINKFQVYVRCCSIVAPLYIRSS